MKRWSFLLLIGMMDCCTVSAQDADPLPVRNEDGQLRSVQPVETRRDREGTAADRASVTAHVLLGHLLLSRGEELAALRALQTAWHADASRVEILPDIIAISARNQRSQQAARYALLAVQRPLRSRSDAALVADKLNESGEYLGAARAYRRLLQLESDAETRLAIQFDLARCLFLAQDYRGAAGAFERLLRGMKAPAAATDRVRREKLTAAVEGMRWLIAETMLLADRPAQALRQYRLAFADAAHKPRLVVAEAKVALAQGRAEDAWKSWTAAVAMPPATIDFSIAERILRKRAPRKWRELLLDHVLQLRSRFPKNLQLARMSALELWQAKRYDESLQAHDSWHDLAANEDSLVAGISAHLARDNDARVLQLLGELALARGSLSSLEADQISAILSEKRMQRLVALAQARKQVARGEALALGLLAVRQRNESSATLWMKRTRRDLKTTDAVWQSWGLELLEVGDAHQSRTVFQQALVDDRLKRRDLMQFYLAGAAMLEGSMADATRAARLAAKARPQEPRFVERLGIVLLQAGRLRDAEQVFRQMLARFADASDEPTRQVLRDVRMTLSEIDWRRGKKRQAARWLHQVLNEYPDNLRAKHDLAYLWVDQDQNVRRAMTVIQSAVAANPENSTYRRSLGWALYRKGEYGKAVKELERALSGAVNGVILDHLGDAYWGAGRADRARKAWSQASEHLQDDDDRPRLQAVLKKVADLDAGRLNKIRR